MNEETFVTPKTHPYLFSFNGRWSLRRNVYKASMWPGTSVSVLSYGDKFKFKIKCPQKTGIVKDHYFIASIENGPQLVLSLPPYNATENQVFDLEIGLPQNAKAKPSEQRTHLPRVVELTSEPGYPLSLIGVTMQNLQIHQGRAWMNKQNQIPHIEYISDKAPGSPVLNRTAIYKASRQLGLRQSYVVSYNTCFSNCSPRHAGLAEQYSYFEPFPYKRNTHDVRLPMPSNYVFHRDQPLVMTSAPGFIILDVGDNDLLNEVPGPTFLLALQEFLASLLLNARPEARVYVLVRANRYECETETAILSLQPAHLASRLYAVRLKSDTTEWYKSFYCAYIVPFADEGYKYREFCSPAFRRLAHNEAFPKLWSGVVVALAMFTLLSSVLRRRAILPCLNRMKLRRKTRMY